MTKTAWTCCCGTLISDSCGLFRQPFYLFLHFSLSAQRLAAGVTRFAADSTQNLLSYSADSGRFLITSILFAGNTLTKAAVLFAVRNISAWLAHRDYRRLGYGLHLNIKNFRDLKETVNGNAPFSHYQKFRLFYRQPLLGRHPFGASVYRRHVLNYTSRNTNCVTLCQEFRLFKQGLSRTIFAPREVVLPFIISPAINQVSLALNLNVFTDAGYVHGE